MIGSERIYFLVK